MSETNTAPQDGAEPAEPAVTEGSASAATDVVAETTDDDDRRNLRAERRIAELSAKLTARIAAGEAERNRMAAELDQFRRRSAPPQPERPVAPEDIDRVVEERVAQQLAARTYQEMSDRFHEAGRKAVGSPDAWAETCKSLIAMGADGPMSNLLLEMPDGAAVAVALADDPAELQRIADLKTERARAIALGKYAASVESKPTPPARNVSKAPAPIRPITGASARTEVLPEEMTEPQFKEWWNKQTRRARPN